MIVVMKQGASQEQIEHMVQRVEELGLKAHPIYGTERIVIAAIGDKRDEHRQSLESGPGVAEVVPILAPYKVASLEVKPERTVVQVGPLSVGNCHLGIIAGPCAVEGMEQTLATARAVKAAGATALRGGAFKPRTSPYSFQGLKEEGLKILAAARDETGLPVVTLDTLALGPDPLPADHILQVQTDNLERLQAVLPASGTGASGTTPSR